MDDIVTPLSVCLSYRNVPFQVLKAKLLEYVSAEVVWFLDIPQRRLHKLLHTKATDPYCILQHTLCSQHAFSKNVQLLLQHFVGTVLTEQLLKGLWESSLFYW